jgi:DNA modification methylase
MMISNTSVADRRLYNVRNTVEARQIALELLDSFGLAHLVTFGLPEIDDRSHVWRICVVANDTTLGEVVIDAKTGQVKEHLTTKKELLQERLGGETRQEPDELTQHIILETSELESLIMCGDSETALERIPQGSVGLIFTSPPYFNARLEYADYFDYDGYLDKMAAILERCHNVLAEGRFIVINISPVLIRRENRNKASKRIAVPFDFHRILIDKGFEFIDDIIWEKPEGAGWATGRGRRFAADRKPLQYKPVPVTEYLLVYRKKTDKLIDDLIHNHHDQAAVAASKITGEYDRTNIWRLTPAHSKLHPAIFPVKLADKVIRYYSFVGDIVLDPFAGSGTVGEAAFNAKRNFILIEKDQEYSDLIYKRMHNIMLFKADSINRISI